MKKITIFILVVVLVLAALPIVGNKLIENAIDDRLTTLSSYGLEISEAQTDSSYLTTQKHFKFLLKDSQKLIAYLNQYSDKQIPPYVDAMFEGVLIGADVEYSNFPLTKDIIINIYPLSLSQKMMQDMKADDLNFHDYLEKFLHSQGILYHINYNIMSEDFKGNMKDIKESYTLKDGTILSLNLLNATYSGNGELIAPNTLISNIEKINLVVENREEKLTFILDDFSSSSVFESQSTYITGGDLKKIQLSIDAVDANLFFNASDIKVNFSSNSQGEKTELNSRSSLSALSIQSDKIDFVIKDFIYDMAMIGLDKDSLEELRILTSQLKVSSSKRAQKEIQNAAIKLISHGLEVDIAKLSLNNIILNQVENLEGFSVQSKLQIREDKDFTQKIKLSPLLVANNLDMSIKVKVSQALYAKLNSAIPMTSLVSRYAKNDTKSVLFDIAFINGELLINGQALQ